MIKFSNFTFRYPRSEKTLFNGINLHIPAGTISLVAGPSGSGKSTFLRCINGLVPHFSGGTIAGSLSVSGKNPIEEGPEKLSEIVGFVFQEPEAQFVYDTVEDEIAFVLENFGTVYPEMHQRVTSILKTFDLERFRQEKMQNLSGGEKQKVALASVMINQPEILLLDEPTSQLDPISAEELLHFIVKIKSQFGLTVLISEHRLERLLPYIDYIINIDKSHQFLFGTPQEILPEMQQVPPIIKIARNLGLSPLPLTVETFPKIGIKESPPIVEKEKWEQPKASQVALKLSNVSTQLNGKKILENVNLEVKCGEIQVIIGPNGSGKTTLLRSLMGLIPSDGQRFLFEKSITDKPVSQIIGQIAYLPQNPNDLLFAESVAEELEITLRNNNQPINHQGLQKFLSGFNLSEKMDQYPRDLSVGERQRTALAAVTVHHPEVILLDEPTRGMAYENKTSLKQLLMSLKKQKKAIVLVTHDVEFAAELADRVSYLEEGKIIFTGDPRKFFTHFQNYRTQVTKLFPKTAWIKFGDINFNRFK